ncbi:MAG TPA: sulfatase-like hydrolase/transferase [Thermomicrobiales bacterium]|jgi:arylsulfatase A-like enzyme|nr:sulfatase-like hydrolase/transferase [Thermomicrobiales bacterium]
MATTPNIVLVMTDQQRADFLASDGFALDTMPFVDSLGAGGTTFRRAYTPTPVCAPARTSLLTGRYPKVTQVRQNSATAHARHGGDLIDVLRERGYAVHLAGKNHSHRPGGDFDTAASYMHEGGGLSDRRSAEDERFDGWLRDLDHGVHPEPTPFPLECQLPYRIVSDAIAATERPAEKPFFLWLSFPEPHNPYQVPEPYFSLFPEADIPNRIGGPETIDALGPKGRWLQRLIAEKRPGYDEHWRRYRANYCGMLRLIDDQVRRFVEHLRATGQWDDTVLVFCSDHGDFAGDYGLQRKGAGLPECLVRVPLVVCGPGVRAQVAADEHVSLVDLMPTICDLAGAPVPYGVQGRSLWPLLSGSGNDHDPAAFRSVHAEVGFGGAPYGKDERPPLHFTYEGPTFDELNSWTMSGTMKMVRMGRWKLVVDAWGDSHLYDLETDPGELHDRHADSEYRDVRLTLTEELLRWAIETDDDLPIARYVATLHGSNRLHRSTVGQGPGRSHIS